MDKLRNSFIWLITLVQILGVHTTCSADLTFKLLNGFSFTKGNTTIENLDHGKYKHTQVTTSWFSNRVTTYSISPELLWTNKSTNTYVKLLGTYGWVIDGKNRQYPFHWKLDGNTKGFEVEAGYICDVKGLFTFIPCIGFTYNLYDTKIKHQRFSHRNIGSFIGQNGNKNRTLLYFPYIGFEIDVKSQICKYDVIYSLSYNLGYGGGHGRNKVSHTVITDLPSTSRYGSHFKFRDMVSHDFEFAIAYSPAKKWVLALLFDYNVYYNTKKLPLKLDHKHALVKKAQFTKSQHFAVSDVVAHEYSVIFEIAYSLTGEGGTFISH